MKTRSAVASLIPIVYLVLGSSPAFSQDFSGTWQWFANGVKGELYLTQSGSQIRGWIGFNGVNLQQDVIVGSVVAKEIRFTRSSSHLVRPQEYVGYLLVANQPQIEVPQRMTGPDAIGGTFLHPGFPTAGWYAIRSGPYRENPGAPPALPSAGLAGAWSINAAGDLGRVEFSVAGSGFDGRIRFDVLGVWEPLQVISFDGRAVRFVRPRGSQVYTGTLSGDTASGSFTGAGSSAWSMKRAGAATPVATSPGTTTVSPGTAAPPSLAAGLAGAWSINAAGDLGRIEFSVAGSGFSGRIWFDVLGVWEPLQDISFDGRAVRFVRPRGSQVYTGTLSGDTASGSFTGAGSSAWSMKRAGGAAGG